MSAEYIKGPVTLMRAIYELSALAVQDFLYQGDKAIMAAQKELDDGAERACLENEG